MQTAGKFATQQSVDSGTTRVAGQGVPDVRRSTRHELHRTVGNQTLQRLLRSGVFQAQFTVSRPDDVYEQEADRVADQVMRMPEPAQFRAEAGETSLAPRIQRLCPACEEKLQRQMPPEEEEPLAQAKREDTGQEQAATDIEAYVGSLAGRGALLAPAARAFMEPRFGAGFSAVRVHTGAEADLSAEKVHARAYTVGPHIVFRAGQYDPDSRQGKHLLAHELAHVEQQGGADSSRTEVQRQPPSGIFLTALGDMDQRFGCDFSRVRTHSDLAAEHRMVQRQPDAAQEKEDEHEKDIGVAGPPQPAPAELPGFGDVAPDAACPRLPTNLGRLAPEPPCPTTAADISGERFTFCRASDVFSPGSERPRLIKWARSQPATSTFVIHGYASESDGTPAQNVNVSCHRAKRVARELYNAGVRSERIAIAARGGTTRFGTGAGKLTLNRVAVVRAVTPNAVTTPVQLPTSRRALVDLAVGKLTRGEYRLAADAYLSRWTCGRMPSLAESVRRSVIRIEGEPLAEFHPDDPRTAIRLKVARLGFPSGVGRNEIVLARETFDDATDPLSCVMARIVDMVFHHAAADVITSFDQKHQAALFLVEMAGLPPCHSPDAQVFQGGTPGRPQFDWWTRPSTDPRQGLQPDCGAFAEGSLPGAITPQPAPATSPAAPTFAVRRFSFDGSGGAATVFVHPDADIDPAKNIAASGRLPGSGTSIQAAASVVASGSPAEVARWQVGFVQTIVSDRVVVDYVGGQRVRFELPVPIRDGPGRARAAPPWFDPDLVDTFTAPGRLAIVGLFAEPWMYFPYHFMDPAQRGRMKEDPTDPRRKVPVDEIDHGNVVNRAHRATVFNTWLVARRDDAPLDRFSTHVLDGRLVAWTQRADFIGAAGTGSFDASVDPTPLTDTTDMQLAGPTAAELEPPTVGATPSPREVMRSRRVVEVAEAPPGVGLSFAEYAARIREIADEIAPLRRALHITDALLVRIRIDPATGRVAIHRPPEAPAADAEFNTGGTYVIYRAAMARFAEEIVFRARKDLVIADTAKIANAGLMPVVITAISEQKRPEDVMSPQRGLGMVDLIAETQLDVESETRRAESPGVFDPEFRVPVNVAFGSERYLFDFTRSFDAVQTACGNRQGGPKSLSCVVRELANVEQLTVNVTSVPELLGVGVVASPIAVRVTLSPVTVQMFIPFDGLAFEGMSGGVTTDSLIHELHHLLDERQLIESLKTRLARAIRFRVMELRRLAASDRSMRAGALTKGAIEAVVWDEYGRYYKDYVTESNRLSDIAHISEDYPVLTEAEIRRVWPAFRMPRRLAHKGSFEP